MDDIHTKLVCKYELCVWLGCSWTFKQSIQTNDWLCDKTFSCTTNMVSTLSQYHRSKLITARAIWIEWKSRLGFKTFYYAIFIDCYLSHLCVDIIAVFLAAVFFFSVSWIHLYSIQLNHAITGKKPTTNKRTIIKLDIWHLYPKTMNVDGNGIEETDRSDTIMCV